MPIKCQLTAQLTVLPRCPDIRYADFAHVLLNVNSCSVVFFIRNKFVLVWPHLQININVRMRIS